MRKNKTVAYMLAATLLVGGTFAGTKALFSDTETSNNPLILTAGKVDISVDDTEGWSRYDADGILIEQNKGSFSDIAVGESYMKNIDISNEHSTYDVSLAITESLNGVPEKLKPFIKVEKTVVDSLAKGKKTSMRVKVSLNDIPGAEEVFNGAGTLNLNAAYQITATQK